MSSRTPNGSSSGVLAACPAATKSRVGIARQANHVPSNGTAPLSMRGRDEWSWPVSAPGCGDQPKVTTRMPRPETLTGEPATLQALTVTWPADVTFTPPNTTELGTAVDPVKLNRTAWPT